MVDTAMRRMPNLPTTPWLDVMPPATRLVFYGDERAQTAAAAAWGPAFSQEACRAATHNSRAALWLGPDEYLLLDTEQAGTATDTSTAIIALRGALEGLPHALVDVSHRQLALRIGGEHAEDILSGACPLDLDLSQFPVGMCTRTVFAKADIVLWRTEPALFHMEVWRSFGDYVTGILREIAVEYGTGSVR